MWLFLLIATYVLLGGGGGGHGGGYGKLIAISQMRFKHSNNFIFGFTLPFLGGGGGGIGK